MGLAKGKASGPDDLPNEFAQIYWDDLKVEIMAFMEDFYHNRSDLQIANRANVVMIRKHEAPTSVHDYRPISILNLVLKLISKVLTNRLRDKLPDLISYQQTAFIKG